MNNKDRAYYIELLRQKSQETGRLPKKSDFAQEDSSRIKSLWGPWPHALRAAVLLKEKD